MQILFFITSGLFLGWSLGANDAANIFGTAVGTRMIKFRKAAIIASIFVILGAVMQGSGTTNTLSQLGKVDALGGAFTVALCSAIVVAAMTRYKLPVSTSQAIVGSIVAWCYFTSNAVDYSILSVLIGSWIYGPVLGALFAALLYLALRRFIRKVKIHVIKLDSIIRNSLIIVGAFGAYSLGANNIANVMGVFVHSTPLTLNIGSMSFNSVQILFFAGGLAIAVGILTYSKKVMETVGGGILSLTPETAIVVVLSQALVLFIFSSSQLSNLFQSIGLPAIPMVPVSSTQVVVGSVLGIGMVRGVQEIKFKMLGSIGLGWIITPLLSGVLTFFSLYIMNNVFDIAITGTVKPQITNDADLITPVILNFPFKTGSVLILILITLAILMAFFIQYSFNKSTIRLKENEKRWQEQMQYSHFQNALSEIEVKKFQEENATLAGKLDEKRKELTTYALSIGEQRAFLETICKSVEEANLEKDETKKKELLSKTVKQLKLKMSFTDEMENIYLQAEQVYNEFPSRLKLMFPELTEQERRLTVLLRIGFSSKEIAPVLNISPKSVEIGRYRLRKKLNLSKEDNLTHFIKTI